MQLLYQKKAKGRLWNKQLCSLKTENMMKGIWKYLYTSINSGFTKITKEYRLKFSVFTTKSSTKFDKYNKVFAGNEYEEQGYPCHGVVNFKKMVIFFEKINIGNYKCLVGDLYLSYQLTSFLLVNMTKKINFIF